jgi:hypothetical protein
MRANSNISKASAGFRVMAMRQSTADKVRSTMRSPGYGHPASVEVATGYGPCRLCLRTFRIGGAVESLIERLFADNQIRYIHVRDTDAGCYDFRIERA